MATRTAELRSAELTAMEFASRQEPVRPGGRLVSLDAYRGFIMLLLASSGFGLSVLANHPAPVQRPFSHVLRAVFS